MDELKPQESRRSGSVALSVLVPLVRPAVYAAALLESLSRALGDGAAQAEVLLVPLAPGAAAEESLAWPNNSSKLWSVRTIEDGPEQRGVYMTAPWYRPCCASSHATRCPCSAEGDDRQQAQFSQLFEPLAESRGLPAGALAAALNRAAEAASGRTLLLLSDVTDPHAGFWRPLEMVLASGDVGVAGARVLDVSGRITHAGLDIALGQPPTDRPYEVDDDRRRRRLYPHHHDEYDFYARLENDTAVPVHRWQGLQAEPTARPQVSWIGGGEEVIGVSLDAMAVRADHWRTLGGLNESMPPAYAALDLCLRAHAEGLATVYVNSSVMIARTRPPSSSSAEASGLASIFTARWGAELEARIARRWRVRLPLVWNMECGAGQVHGFTDEAITFATALESAVDLRLEISEIWRCRESVLRTLPRATRDAVTRLSKRRGGREGAILVVHRDPGRYEHFVTLGERASWYGRAEVDSRDPYHAALRDFDAVIPDHDARLGLGDGNSLLESGLPGAETTADQTEEERREARWLHRQPIYTIGRSMFETSGIPSDWAQSCNEWVDEVWLPSEFNRKTFADAGVEPGRLFVMPQPLDTQLFDPERTAPLPLPFDSGFVFLSVFKWEQRKGWDVLLRAYLTEFSATDDVVLLLRVSTDENNRADLARWLTSHVICDAAASVDPDPDPDPSHPAAAGDGIGMGVGAPFLMPLSGCSGLAQRWRALPPVVLLDEMLAADELPRLYRAADAFVLPSRGEGWGRPVMEAMAMGLPAIATNWSGTTAFLSERTGFPLPYELVPAADGQHWSEPVLFELRRLMRHVYEQPEDARRKGQAARAHVRRAYSQQAVAEQLIARLQQLEPTLLASLRDREEARKAAAAAEEAAQATRQAELLFPRGLNRVHPSGDEAGADRRIDLGADDWWDGVSSSPLQEAGSEESGPTQSTSRVPAPELDGPQHVSSGDVHAPESPGQQPSQRSTGSGSEATGDILY